MQDTNQRPSASYCLLGRTGIRGSSTALGTLNFGEGEWGLSRKAAQEVLDTFRECGGNLIDTAPGYGKGAALGTLRALMAGERDRFVIMSKVGMVASLGNPNSAGLSRKAIEGAVRTTLKELNTDYIDILVVHAHDRHADVASWCATLVNLVRRGVIHEWGVSNVPSWVLSEAATRGEMEGTPMSVAHFEYSVTCRDPELELIPAADRWNTTVMAWSPLNGGILAGRHSDPLSTIRRRGFSGRLTEREKAAMDVLAKASDSTGLSPAALAISWVRGKGVIPIVSASSADQIRDIMMEHEVIDSSFVRSLDRVAQPSPHYPQSWLDQVEGELFGRHTVVDRLPAETVSK